MLLLSPPSHFVLYSLSMTSEIISISSLTYCAVCQKRSNQFNYGAITCNACKMFFKRAVKSSEPPEQCINPSEPHDVQVCRFCRFQKCRSAGMALPNSLANEPLSIELFNLLHALKRRDDKRSQALYNSQVSHVDPSLEDAITRRITFRDRPTHLKLECSEWMVLARAISVNYLKKLEPTHQLELMDQRVLIKEFTLIASFFHNARIAYVSKKGALQFVDGTDCCPPNNFIDESFENRIRFRLVGRLAELQLTNEEYLLLVPIFYCNPALAGLSNRGKDSIGMYREKYSSLLFQYCRLNYQQSAPSRFTDLLSLCHVLHSTFEDLKHHRTLFMMNLPQATFKKLVHECMD